MFTSNNLDHAYLKTGVIVVSDSVFSTNFCARCTSLCTFFATFVVVAVLGTFLRTCFTNFGTQRVKIFTEDGVSRLKSST